MKLGTICAGSPVHRRPCAPGVRRRSRCHPGTTARRRSAIVAFVAKVTKEGSPDFVPPAERIAVFDNDGTLWAEQPMYFQFFFALDRVKALAPQHPEWKDEGAVRLAAQGRRERRARGRRTRNARNLSWPPTPA